MPRARWVAAAVLVVGVAALGALRWSAHRGELARLPALPDFAEKTAAIERHIREADETARHAPGSADAIGALGIAYHSDNFYNEAGVCYALALALAPSAWIWKYYGVLLDVDLAHLDRVPETLREVAALEPGFAPAWFKLAEEDFKHGNLEEAAREYERSIDVFSRPAPKEIPRLPSRNTVSLGAHAQFGLARIALRRNQSDRARQILERLILEAPDFGPAHRLLGETYRTVGRNRDADDQLAHANAARAYTPPADPMLDAIAMQSRSSVTLLRHAAVAARAGDDSWKEFLVERAAEFDPDNPVVLNEKRLLARARRLPEAGSPRVAVEDDSSERGRALYSSACAVCHNESGEGQLGKAPPLAGSERLLGSDEPLARIVLGGLRGPLTGSAYSSEMPSLSLLSDDEIAAVLTYVRRRWGRDWGAVEPALVGRVRRATSVRQHPWTYAELEAFK